MVAPVKIRLTAVSPVHVGGGMMWPGTDFVADGARTVVLSRAKFWARLADEEFRAAWSENPRKLGELLESKKIRAGELASYTLGGKVGFGGLRGFSRALGPDGEPRPVMPGSAFKGALRSALLWHLAHDLDGAPRPRLEKRFQTLVSGAAERGGARRTAVDRAVLGMQDSRTGSDPMAAVLVRDAALNPQTLGIAAVKVSSVLKDGKIMWKAGRDGHDNVPRHDNRDAVQHFVEVLRAGSAAVHGVRLDEGSLQHWGLSAAVRGEIEQFFAGWFTNLNWQAYDFIAREQAALARWRLDRVAQFYTGLFHKVESELYDGDQFKTSKAAYVRLGWGIGYDCLTGRVLGDAVLAAARRSDTLGPRMGRPGFETFPKTRKLVCDDKGPMLPLGWAKLEIVG